MMKRPVNIRRPELKDARSLSALELNSFRFDVKHTVLTPDLLRKAAQPPDNKNDNSTLKKL